MKIINVNFKAEYDIQNNFERMVEIVTNQGAETDIIVFPEAALQGYEPFMEEKSIKYFQENSQIISPDNRYIKTFLDLSSRLSVNIAFGMIEKDRDYPERIYNSAVLIQPNGQLDIYRKVHLATNEHYIFHSGENFQVIQTNIGRVGFLICYDICFPEAARTLALRGAQIIFLLSAWGYDDQDINLRKKSSEVFKVYAQARAVENQVLLIVSNQGGSHSAMNFLGESKIILPNGMIYSMSRQEPDIQAQDIDLTEALLEERLYNLNALNLIKNRKESSYKLFS